MKKITAAFALLLSACYSYSAPMTEEVVVEATPFAPAQSGMGIGSGTDHKGRSVTTTEFVSIDAAYAVVLRCDAHGRFAVQGSDERHKQLWSRFQVGDRLTVVYREKRNLSGERVGFDFISADPVRE